MHILRSQTIDRFLLGQALRAAPAQVFCAFDSAALGVQSTHGGLAKGESDSLGSGRSLGGVGLVRGGGRGARWLAGTGGWRQSEVV